MNRPRRQLILAVLPWVLTAPAAAAAQIARVAVSQENIRQEPRGSAKKLASLLRGTPVRIVGRKGSWRQVTLDGWIWAPSVSRTRRDGFDLVVSQSGGENLRARPNGPRIGFALQGFLLKRVGEVGSWKQIRRTAWMWGPSLEEGAETEPGVGDSASVAASAPPARTAATPRRTPSAGVETGAGVLTVRKEPAAMLRSPRGDTVGLARRGSDLHLIARQGNWARVQLEGWVWLPGLVAYDSAATDGGLSAADLRANPEQYRGRRVRWVVQFISLQRAEPMRTDFAEDEPFLLTRGPDTSQGFVYVAVPSSLLSMAEQLKPLQRVQILARVRTGRSALMGAPVLDLLALQRAPEAPVHRPVQ